jgi:DNA-directed RNA polymerase specialized sigma24 family protein
MCCLDGSRVRGSAYRRGRAQTGDARVYRFDIRETDMDTPSARPVDSSLTQAVLQRLATLLTPADIDLLYLHYVAGWSLAALAPECNCHRGTIMRRQKRILALLCRDPVLRQLTLPAQTARNKAR